MSSPLDQFLINRIWYITNSQLYILISIFIIFYIFLSYFTYNTSTFLDRYNIIILNTYKILESIYRDILSNDKRYSKYLPILISLFLFLLFNNVLGLIPYSFTITSHIIITITLSLSIVLGITILGFQIHRISFFKLFIPSGLNKGNIKYIIPLIFFIELLSYFIRIISLSVRLTANIMSGHTLLKIVSNFSLSLYQFFFSQLHLIYIIFTPIILFLPLFFISGIYLLEIAVAFIQSYVFTLLTLTYLKDIIYLH